MWYRSTSGSSPKCKWPGKENVLNQFRTSGQPGQWIKDTRERGSSQQAGISVLEAAGRILGGCVAVSPWVTMRGDWRDACDGSRKQRTHREQRRTGLYPQRRWSYDFASAGRQRPPSEEKMGTQARGTKSWGPATGILWQFPCLLCMLGLISFMNDLNYFTSVTYYNLL